MSENKFDDLFNTSGFNEAADSSLEQENKDHEHFWQEVAGRLYSDMRQEAQEPAESTRFLLAKGADIPDMQQLPSFQGTTTQLKLILQQLA